jgi:hypothetical protein
MATRRYPAKGDVSNIAIASRKVMRRIKAPQHLRVSGTSSAA